jgi:hypothetical protein
VYALYLGLCYNLISKDNVCVDKLYYIGVEIIDSIDKAINLGRD